MFQKSFSSSVFVFLSASVAMGSPPLHGAADTGLEGTAPLDVAIYTCDGANSEHIMAVFRAVAGAGHRVHGIAPADIDRGRLNTDNFDVLILPAGEDEAVREYHGASGLGSSSTLEGIQDFVAAGGGFLGIEAGALFAAANGGDLDLYDGIYVPWGGAVAGVYTFEVVDETFGPREQDAYMSVGGGYIQASGTSTDIVDNVFGNAVAVRDTYGAGRVVLTSVNWPLRADSYLDWTIWDNWQTGGIHSDSQGAWSILGQMLDWAGGGDAEEPVIESSNPDGASIAVISTHTGPGGAWPGLLPALGRAIEDAGHVPLALRFDDVIDGMLSTSDFDVVVFPGGYAAGYIAALGGHEDQVRDFVASGGGYLGICAGSYYASDRIRFDGVTYDYPLNLYYGIDIGAIDEIAPWPQYTLATVEVNDPVVGKLGTQQQFYYGGGFKPIRAVIPPMSSDDVNAVAIYQGESGAVGRANYVGKPDAVRFMFGKGHVLLTGTHPESLSGSDDDWLFWNNYQYESDEALENPDNPWTFVDAVFNDWLVAGE